MTRFQKNYRVVKELVRLRFQNLMMFRLGFFGPFFVDGSMFAIQLLVFRAVYSNIDRIGSWGEGEVILYIGTFSLLDAVSMVICFFGVIDIAPKILSGEMDLYLTKPVSPLLRLTFEKVNPGSVPLVAMSVLIIIYGAWKARIELTAGKIAAYLFWFAVMEFLYYCMEVLMRCIAFFTVSTAKMERLEEAGLDLCMKLPGIALYGVWKLIFYCFLPYGIMATLPVQSMVGEMSWKLGLFGIAVVGFFGGLTCFTWKKGVRRYNSASS